MITIDDVFKVAGLLLTVGGMALITVRANKKYLDHKFEQLHRKMDSTRLDVHATKVDIAEMKVKVEHLWKRV